MDYEAGDIITIAGCYRRRTIWQWLTRRTRELVVYTVTETPTPGCYIKGE